jgi:hypothetical protein
MSIDSNDRAQNVVTAFITAFAGRSVRGADPTETFRQGTDHRQQQRKA